MRRQKTGAQIVLACALATGGVLSACAKSPRTQTHPSGGGGAPGAGSGGAGSDAGVTGTGGVGQTGGAGTGGVGQTGGAGGAEPSAAGGAAGVAGGAGGASGGASPGASGGAGGASAGGNGGAGPVALPPGPVAPAYFHAGTRLKPRVLRGGGLEVLDTTAGMSWFDTVTGDWCVFRTGADGVERCFPDAGSDGIEYFLDSACKKPAFLGSALRCDGGNFHHVSFGPNGSSACDSVTYRLGQPVTGANTPLYSTASGRCELSGPAAQTNMVWPLEKVPVETFVAVHRVRRQVLPNVDIGLDAWVREGADGSWEVIGFYDPVRKGPCARLAWDVSSDACVPTWAEANSTFSDSTCTQRAAFDDPFRQCSPSGTKALLDLETTGDSCSATTTIKALWETTVRSTQLYDYDPGARSCKRSSLGVVTTYGQGARIDVASLPKLEIIPVGTGSLRLAFYAFDKVPFYPANGGAEFVEAASGHPCTPRPFADGTWRCVPSTYPRIADYDQFYLTPDCTGERIFPWVNSCPNTPPEPVGMVVHLFGCGRTVTETLAFEGTTSQGALFHPTPGLACSDLTFTVRDGVKLFRATKPVNPAELFVPFERKLAE